MSFQKQVLNIEPNIKSIDVEFRQAYLNGYQEALQAAASIAKKADMCVAELITESLFNRKPV